MECEEFKKLASSYVAHQLPQEKIQEIEEHLCICEFCRNYLKNILEESPQAISSNTLKEKKSEEKKEDKFFAYTILVVAFLLFIFLLYLLLSYKP